MIVPIMLVNFGSEHPTAQMTFGQMLEIFAMLSLSVLGSRFRVRWFIVVGLILGILRFGLFALAGELGMLSVIWVGIALHGPVYTYLYVTGRMFLDKRVPDTMRGQAQALFQLLIGSVAGILGAFSCGWLYQGTVSGGAEDWTWFWLALAVFSVVPLVYFLVGVVGKPATAKI